MSDPVDTIVVVEDELQMRRFLRAGLDAHGFRVIEASTCAAAKVAIATSAPALVLLDLGLPDGDGVTVLRSVREWSQVPIIVLSARGREDDKVTMLDSGADDYLTKPFGIGELLARIRVALRRGRGAATEADAVMAIGPIRIDHTRHEVTRDGELVHLTPIEFRLLALLASHAGKVLTHKQILKEVWGPNAVEQTHYLRVHMAALRRKIEADPARPRWLTTELGVGYRFRDDPPA